MNIGVTLNSIQNRIYQPEQSGFRVDGNYCHGTWNGHCAVAAGAINEQVMIASSQNRASVRIVFNYGAWRSREPHLRGFVLRFINRGTGGTQSIMSAMQKNHRGAGPDGSDEITLT